MSNIFNTHGELNASNVKDALSQKILDQFPESLLPAEERPLVEENLGRYITRSFRLFEPALGWNPRLSKWWSKESQQLIDRAIVSTDGNPKYYQFWPVVAYLP